MEQFRQKGSSMASWSTFIFKKKKEKESSSWTALIISFNDIQPIWNVIYVSKYFWGHCVYTTCQPDLGQTNNIFLYF